MSFWNICLSSFAYIFWLGMFLGILYHFRQMEVVKCQCEKHDFDMIFAFFYVAARKSCDIIQQSETIADNGSM